MVLVQRLSRLPATNPYEVIWRWYRSKPESVVFLIESDRNASPTVDRNPKHRGNDLPAGVDADCLEGAGLVWQPRR